MKEEIARFEAVRIDGDAEKEVAAKYGVGAMPDFRVLKPDGTEVYKIQSGYLPPEDLVRELESGLAKAK